MRASTRSPTPMLASMSTSGPRALRGVIKTSGRSPSSSHTAGLAMRSPWLSRPVTSRIVTGGRPPFRRRLLRSPDSMPSSAMLASRRLNSMRSGPRTPNARAISRLPTLVGDVLMYSRISSRPGSPARLGGPLLGPPLLGPLGRRGMSACPARRHVGALRVGVGRLALALYRTALCGLAHLATFRSGLGVFRASLAFGRSFAHRLLLFRRPLGGARGDEFYGFGHAE